LDPELLAQIQAYVAANARLAMVAQEKANVLRERVADRFQFPESHLLWWECLPQSAEAIDYEGEDGLMRLSNLLKGEQGEWQLFVTDNEPPPWPCVVGPPMELIEMVREQRFFEYFLVDKDLRRVIFDTHHNTLVVYPDVRCQ
jgi:hypothetical protein